MMALNNASSTCFQHCHISYYSWIILYDSQLQVTGIQFLIKAGFTEHCHVCLFLHALPVPCNNCYYRQGHFSLYKIDINYHDRRTFLPVFAFVWCVKCIIYYVIHNYRKLGWFHTCVALEIYIHLFRKLCIIDHIFNQIYECFFQCSLSFKKAHTHFFFSNSAQTTSY